MRKSLHVYDVRAHCRSVSVQFEKRVVVAMLHHGDDLCSGSVKQNKHTCVCMATTKQGKPNTTADAGVP